jgi:XdhC/CoxI family protein
LPVTAESDAPSPEHSKNAVLVTLLRDTTLDPSWMENLYAPAGLDIGSEAPEEIALSIVSEVAAVLSKRRGGFLRDRVRAIHSNESQTIEHAASYASQNHLSHDKFHRRTLVH